MMIATRPARLDDIPDIMRLVIALATYEREHAAVVSTEDSLRTALFGENPQTFATMLEADGAIRGLALWFLTFSTWTGRPSLHLEDLFVEPDLRGAGAGRALMRALAREAKQRGCARLDWSVLDWNEPAMAFYRTIGATRLDGWQPWRLSGDALDRLAESGG